MLRSRDKLGDYEIVARLKAGGMAQVYLARRKGAAGFTRPVALKLIHPHLATEAEFVRMFVDEATLSSKIEAPNVVHIEELGQIDGTWFQAMEYVHGAALSQVVRALRAAGRRAAPELAVHIVAEIATGLHAAHETTDAAGAPLGIVHRDVSPHNVLLSYRGNVKVCDFGIAKAMLRAQGTKSDAVRGKIAYMPPEQAWGEQVDRRADVYALAIVLWELLVLARPFDADNDIALLDQARHPRIERPSTRTSGIPAALDDVVMRALAPAPEDRPQTAAEFRRLLLDAVPGARHVESDDVAALLRGVMGEEIEEQAKLLPMVSESTVLIEVLASAGSERRADDAIRHLTLPAVVVPTTATLPAGREATPAANRALPHWSGGALLGLACAAALAAAFAVRLGGRAGTGVSSPGEAPSSSAARTAFATEDVPAAAASASLEPPRTPPGGSSPDVVALPSVPASGMPSARASRVPSASASGASSAVAVATPTRPRRPAPHPLLRTAPSSATPSCRKVGGVELCE